MMKMRLFRELIISGLPNFSTEYLMKEDEGGKILIREILEREGDKSYSPEEHIWKYFSRNNYSSTILFGNLTLQKVVNIIQKNMQNSKNTWRN